MTGGTPLGRGSLREGAQEGLHQSETSRRWRRGGEGIPAEACWGLPCRVGGTPLCGRRRRSVHNGTGLLIFSAGACGSSLGVFGISA